MRNWIRLIFIGLPPLIALGCAGTGRSASDRSLLHLQLGTAHLAQGSYPQALQELLEAEKLDPKNAIVQNNLGLAYFVRERLDPAEQKIRNAIALDPKYTDAKNNLGKVLIEKGKATEAIKILEEASRDLTYAHPQKVFANLGLAYFRAKDFSRASETLKKSLQMEKSDCMSSNYYGRSLLELNDFERAKNALDQTIIYCKGLVFDEPYYFSAISYLKMGDSDRAYARLKELVEKFPNGEYFNEASRLLKALK